uniref:Uncharacterized protein n=1 Tax=Arundo donax TaxID=35708 RepID=A0A0A9D5T7_ARUDO
MTFCSLAEWDKIVSLQGKFLIILSIVLTSMLMKCSFALFILLDSLSEATSLDNDFLGDNNSLISDILANNSLVSFITPGYEVELISLTSESNSSDDSGKIEAIISKRCFHDVSFIA